MVMTDTPTNGDLIKRLEKAHTRMAGALAGVHIDDLHAIRDARDALEAAERVIAPFALLSDSWVIQTAAHRGEMVTVSNGERMCGIEAKFFVNASDWLARHATGQQGGR